MIAPPIAHIEAVDRQEANRLLVCWGHRMGPLTRPAYAIDAHHVLMHHNEPVAIACTSETVRETVGKSGIARGECIELARLAAATPTMCRPMLRLWREFVAPAIAERHGRRPWAVSYQDKSLHTGNLYRFDGWTDLGAAGGGGTDPRSGRRARSMRVWGWRLAA